jgi:hypothetical protein
VRIELPVEWDLLFSLVGIGLLTVWVRWYYHNGYKACKANQYIVNAIEIR